MSFLTSNIPTLTRLDEEWKTISTESALKGKKVICLLFSALWCPPCRPFCKVLKAAYEIATEETNDFEIVFISSDRNEDKMKQYMKEYHGNWLAIPYNPQVTHRLKSEYTINSIPKLVVCKDDGSVITEDGKDLVTRFGAGAMIQWLKYTE